jgi:hypothetical protein
MACGCKKKKQTVKKTVIQQDGQTLSVGTKKSREELIAELQKRIQ